MRGAAIAIALSLAATARAAPASLPDSFARLAAREPLPQLCFAATADRALIACLGTTDGPDEALYFLHVLGPSPSDGALWRFFLQNDAAHPGKVDQGALDDAAAYFGKHGLRPAAWNLVALGRDDGASAKVGAWTVRRVVSTTADGPRDHLEIVCGTTARAFHRSDVLDMVLDTPPGQVEIALASLTRDELLVVTTQHDTETIEREAVRLGAAALCRSKPESLP